MMIGENLRYGWRRLWASPGFAVAVLAVLTIGIGANTAIFSVVHGVLLNPLSFPAPEQLVAIHEGIPEPGAAFPELPVNANHYLYWCANSQAFAGIAAMGPTSMPLGGPQPEEIGVMQNSANLFRVLEVQPRLGRSFSADEEQPGRNNVVILSDGLWKRRYGADPQIVGKAVMLDGRPYVVVGVLPADFSFPMSTAEGRPSKPIDAYVPFGWDADTRAEIEGDHNYLAIGRLKPRVTAQKASAELNALQRAISQLTPEKVHFTATVIPFQEYLTGASRRSLLLLLAAVGAVFLIACVNVANLLLTRAMSADRDTAIKIALGGSKAQLFSGALAEPAILCGIGWLLGIALSMAAVPVLVRQMPIEVPRLSEVRVDFAAIAFAAAVSAIAALVCGTLPIWRHLRADAAPALRATVHTVSGSRATRRVRSALVIAEVAGSVALLAVAGMFVTSIFKLMSVSRGFDAGHVLSADVMLPGAQYEGKAVREAFYERTLRKLRALPGVSSAGVVSVLPLDGDYWGDSVSRIGDNKPRWQRPSAHYRWITPGYFETMRIPLLAGRFLSDQDRGKSVALVSRSVAAKVWPRQSAIGQKFQRSDPDEAPFEVIGVVDDIRTLDLSKPAPPMVYAPYWYRSREAGTFVIRTQQDPAAIGSAVRRAIWSVDSQAAVPSVRTMETVVKGSVAARRFERNLLLGFAISAILLAGLGIYGVVAHSAAERTHEIGIRIAVGASRSDVYSLILSQGITPVVMGTAAGIAIGFLAARLVHSLLFEVSASEPSIAIAATLIPIVAGVCACLIPARRAAQTEPAEALRFE
jgi:putative ABC transport system permease protein